MSYESNSLNLEDGVSMRGRLLVAGRMPGVPSSAPQGSTPADLFRAKTLNSPSSIRLASAQEGELTQLPPTKVEDKGSKFEDPCDCGLLDAWPSQR